MKENREIKVFCKNIKELRWRNDLSKKQMAKVLGIGTKTLTKIENGILPPRLSCDILIKVYEVFHVLPNMMFKINMSEDDRVL